MSVIFDIISSIDVLPRTLLLLGLVTLVYLALRRRRPSGLRDVPRAPSGHWLTGHAQVPVDDWAMLFDGWRKSVGEVFRFFPAEKLSSVNFVVINDIKMIKDFMTNKDFAHRSKAKDGNILILNPKRQGLLMPDSTPAWKETHKFVMNTLSALGFGRAKMEEKILAEADGLIDELLAFDGAVAAEGPIQLAISNSVTLLLFDQRADIGRPSPLHRSLQTMTYAVIYFFVHPVYSAFPGLLRFFQTKRVKNIIAAKDHVISYIKDTLRDHEKSFNDDEHRDFIDAYISERRKRPDAEHLSLDNFLHITFDLFAAGTDTTTHTLNWTIAWLLHHPEVYDKLRREVLEIVGEDGVPSLGMLKDLHYLHAFMEEVFRRSCVADFSMPKRCAKPVSQFGEFDLTSDDLTIVNIWAVHHDPNLFDEPMKFKPERHLDTNGRFRPNENLIPFSYGNRRCLGEKLARMEQFLFTVRFIQRVKFRLPTGAKLPDMKGIKHFVRTPEPYKVIVEAAT